MKEALQYWTSSCGRLELQLTLDDAYSGSHSGSCDADIELLKRKPYIAAQLSKLDPEMLASELKEWGAWDAEELADHAANIDRVLWLACCDIRDHN